jgi:hypothetical protein
MPIDPDAIARRYAVRPGCRFVGYKAVGLAVFSMNVRALSLEPREIPPIDEFLVRFMLEGIVEVEELSDLLGLNPELVQSRLVELRRQECIEVSEAAPGKVCCILTDRGQELARSLKQTVMQEITVPNLIFHGLLRKPVQLGDRSRRWYLKPKEAKDQGLTLLRAIPNRPPRTEELDIDQLDRVVKTGARRHQGEVKRDIVAVKSVLKMVYTLYDDERRERQVAFAVEGQIADEYETAFRNARGPELLTDVLSPRQEPLSQRIGRHVPKHVIKKLGDLDQVEELTARLAAARQGVDDAKKEYEVSKRADTRQVLREKIEQLEREKAEIERERNARKVKFLWTPEIRDKLWEALRSAKERLLILSGFISSEVVDASFEEALRQVAQRGARIWIGYGFDKGNRRVETQRALSSWRDAEAAFERVRKEFPKQVIYRDVGRSHEKRLICDNRFTFGGSFNLLSFSGERRGRERLRHEGADLVEDPDYCEELYTEYLRLFFA